MQGFKRSRAKANGGALSLQGVEESVIQNVSFTDNTAEQAAGAVALDQFHTRTSTTVLVDCRGTGNRGTQDDSTIYWAGWAYGGRGQSCETVCKDHHLGCASGTWPVLSRAEMEVMIGRTCSSFLLDGNDLSVAPCTNGGGDDCYYNPETGTKSTCSAFTTDRRRLCYCDSSVLGSLTEAKLLVADTHQWAYVSFNSPGDATCALSPLPHHSTAGTCTDGIPQGAGGCAPHCNTGVKAGTGKASCTAFAGVALGLWESICEDACIPNPCLNGGICWARGSRVSNGHGCSCIDGFSGADCSTRPPKPHAPVSPEVPDDSSSSAAKVIWVAAILLVLAAAIGGFVLYRKCHTKRQGPALDPLLPEAFGQQQNGGAAHALLQDNDEFVRQHAFRRSAAFLRNFANSKYKQWYDQASAPENALDLGDALGEMLRAYCVHRDVNIPWDGQNGGQQFFRRLQRQAQQHGEELTPENIKFAAQRLWTSEHRDSTGREFCSILNFALREDDEAIIRPLTTIARAINLLCVYDPGRLSWVENHPTDNVCYRGGGFDDQYREFFQVQHPAKKFRQPAYLATSFSQAISDGFMRRAAANNQSAVRWIIRLDAHRQCMHANLVKRTNVPGEEEYLFPPCPNTVPPLVWQALLVCTQTYRDCI